MTSLLNLTLVVIGSCAEAGRNAKGTKQKALMINAEAQRRKDAKNDPPKLAAPSPLRPLAVSQSVFISIGPAQPDRLDRPVNPNRNF